MAKIFISYSRSDKSIIDELINRLEAAGHQVWVDREGIRGGDQWRTQIVEAIENNDVFLLVLSKNSIVSDHVRAEIDLAKESRKKIVPINLQSVEIPSSMKYQLVGLQHINLYIQYETGLQELLATLGGEQNIAIPGTKKGGELLSSQSPKTRKRSLILISVFALVLLVPLIAYLFIRSSPDAATEGHLTLASQTTQANQAAPSTSSVTALATLNALTTVAEIEPLLLQANIRLSEPVKEEHTRSFFTGPESAYHMLAVASLTVVGEHRFQQPINLDIVDKWYTQAVGSGHAEGEPLDLEQVKQALLNAHNEYYDDHATSLDELLELANASHPTLAPPATLTGGQTALNALTTVAEIEPLLLQANIRLSEPEVEERTRGYFTGPESAYHMLAVASLTVVGERRFRQPINLDIVEKWYSQAAGKDYEARGPLDLEIVMQALIDAHNDYYSGTATSLDDLLESRN